MSTLTFRERKPQNSTTSFLRLSPQCDRDMTAVVFTCDDILNQYPADHNNEDQSDVSRDSEDPQTEVSWHQTKAELFGSVLAICDQKK